METEVKLGSGMDHFRDGNVQYLTLVVTEDCNMRCKYCYEAHKNPNHVMSREVACRAIDFFLSLPCTKPGVVVEFMGGEPTLEMDLITDVARYFRRAVSRFQCHPWQSVYKFQISSNGTTYRSEKVQRFVWENLFHASIAISIDGTPRKHNMHRLFPNGHGSYDVVAENARLWIRQNPWAATKVTFGSEDLPYTCESIVHLWDLGIRRVPANVVFEDVWKPGDPEIFESQLKQLADIALDKGYWRTCNTTLFWDTSEEGIRETEDKNWCGTGKMVAVDSAGNLFPCVRFMRYSLSNPNRPERRLGTIYDGFDQDKLRVYHCLRRSLQSAAGCLECNMQHLCSWCSAYNYDAGDSDTVFQRMIFVCEMHKAQWRANQYYWEQLKRRYGLGPADIRSPNSVAACAC